MGFILLVHLRHPRRRGRLSEGPFRDRAGVPLDRRGAGQRHLHLSVSGAVHPAGAGGAGHRPGRGGAHPGRRLVRPADQHHLAAGAAGAGRRARSPPSPARWENSAPSSPSSPTFPARPGPCRWRSIPRCRRRAAKPRRRGSRRFPSCWPSCSCWAPRRSCAAPPERRGDERGNRDPACARAISPWMWRSPRPRAASPLCSGLRARARPASCMRWRA